MTRNCFHKKNFVLGLFILLFTAFRADAQMNPAMGNSPWKFANPSPIGYSISDISFIDDNVGLAVGSNGGIMRTTDGGRNWVGIPYKYITNTNSVALGNFADVHFVTNTVAYAVGSGGLMVKSTDGGINWAPVTTPLTPFGKNINGLHFLNKDTGYIGGAAINSSNTTNINDAPKVYFTRNGGSTWDSLATPFRGQQNNMTLNGFNTGEIHRIHFVNDSVGYVSGSCGSSVANFSAILWKIEKNVVRDYSIHRTKFGITATTGSYTPATQTFKGLLGINDSLVLISSLNNNVVIRVKTGKNDSTANAVPATYGAYEKGIYEIIIWLNSTPTGFPANLNGNIAGQMQQIKRGPGGKIFIASGNSILTSTDNGTTWSFTRPHPSTVNYGHWGFNGLDITANGKIVVGSFNGLTYDSLPGSPSWQTVYKNARPLFYAFGDMDWADHCNGLAVGSNGTIAKTTDGGKNWINVSNPILEAAQMSLVNVQYQSVNNMFFNTYLSVFKSPDQGTTLNALFTEPNVNGQLNGFTMNGQRAWAIGYRFSPEVQRTMIFRTLNANAATPVWDTVKTFPAGTLAPQPRNIKFANQDTGYVTFNRGKVYRTVNGGNTWTDVSPDTTVNSNGTATYTALSLVNGKTLFVGGSSRKLFKSTDAGVTWTDLTLVVPTGPTPITSFTSVNNIIMNDENNGYLHSGGIVLKTSNAWASWTYDIAPGGFSAISLYPKMAGPIDGKKLYGMPLSAGSPVNSVNTAFLIEYGNASLTTVSTTETIEASCDNAATGRITINPAGGILPYSFSLNGGPFQSSNIFSNLSQGSKTITIKDAGCAQLTKTITVGVKPGLAISAGPDFTVVSGDEVVLNGTSNGTNPTIVWTPSSGLVSANTLTPTAKPSATTTYTLTVTDANGCISTDNATVTIIPYCIRVMDAFTPNGDGMNDRWLVTNGAACTKQIAVNVYNRYGGLVYKNENYNNDWTGTYNGRPVADGTYYYTAVFTTITNNRIILKGDLTILR